MRRFLLAAAAASAAAVLGTGLVSVSAGAQPARQATTTETFQAMSTSATAAALTLVVRGHFTAGGTLVPVTATRSTATLPDGTFRVVQQVATSSQGFNTRTCLVTEAEQGTWTLSDGTGSYAGIAGAGPFSLTILGVTSRNAKGKCNHVQAPATFELLVTATVTLTSG